MSIAPEYQGARLEPRGMVREHLMPVDSPNLCRESANRAVFDRIIDATKKSERLAVDIEEAKSICGRCLVREACLTVHGPDLELGVVGGATDAKRAKMFGGVA